MKAPFQWRRAAGAVLAPIARQLTAGLPRILFLHRVAEDNARATHPRVLALQLEYLTRHFTPVSLDTLMTARNEGRPLPKRAVALTVDDGYRDFGDFIYPLLERYEVPATLFVVSEFAAGELWLWFDQLRFICERSPLKTLRVEQNGPALRFSLASPSLREKTWDELATACLKLEPRARDQSIARIAQGAEVQLPGRPPARFAALDYHALRAFDPALVTLGAHTLTHPILSTCTLQEQTREIAGSKRDLERALARPVEYFCYPNGQPDDFTAQSVSLVKAAGYRAAFTSISGLVAPIDHRYVLPRMGLSTDFTEFRNEVNGVSDLQARSHGIRRAPGEILNLPSSLGV